MTNPLYLALDLPQLDAAKALAEKVKAHVGGFKLGLEFFCAHGHHGVHEIGHVGLPIFLDLKLHDIPNTVAGAMQAIHVLEPAIVTVHASGGRAMMEDAKAAAALGTKVVAVTMLTSMAQEDLADIGINATPAEMVLRLAILARDSGLDGVVCSAQEAALLRERCGKEFCLVTPGIRPAQASPDDQSRVMTPQAALQAGSSYL